MLQKFFLPLFARTLAMTIVTIFFMAGFSSADDSVQQINAVQDLVRSELSKRYGGARIEILGASPIQNSLPEKPTGVRILTETSKGEAQFLVYGDASENSQAQGWVSFAAWAPTRVAVRRILPGEKLDPALFTSQEVNVATGLAREYRGTMLSLDADLSRLEAKQTIVEGQFPLSHGVQKIPDVKRGESIIIKMQSGEIALTTHGTAQEPAYIDGTVRVLTLKTKRELVGQLRTGGVVEVKL